MSNEEEWKLNGIILLIPDDEKVIKTRDGRRGEETKVREKRKKRKT